MQSLHVTNFGAIVNTYVQSVCFQQKNTSEYCGEYMTSYQNFSQVS